MKLFLKLFTKSSTCIKTRRTLNFFIGVLIMLFSVKSFSREWREFYNNSRSNAMGGAKIAVNSDDTSLFRNPSTLGSFRDAYIMALDPEIEFSSAVQSKFASALTDLKKVEETLSGDPGTYYYGKMQLTPTFSLRNFSFGLIYKEEISALMNAAATEMDTIYHSDVGALIGFNYSLWEGRIKFGVTAKAINRIEVDNPQLDVTGPLNMDTIASEGNAFGADVGLMFQAPVIYFPTLAIVARDVGDTKFSAAGLRLSTSTEPLDVKQTIDVGFSLSPIFSNTARGVFAVEYRDVADAREEDFTQKRIHVGTEFVWRDVLYFRLGANQTYLTAGFEISGERWSWQLATYGEEVGTKDAPREDRRYSMRIGVRF